MLPIAVDAMGGDKAPAEILAGVRRAVDDGIPVVLVGPPDLAHDADLPLIPASERSSPSSSSGVSSSVRLILRIFWQIAQNRLSARPRSSSERWPKLNRDRHSSRPEMASWYDSIRFLRDTSR